MRAAPRWTVGDALRESYRQWTGAPVEHDVRRMFDMAERVVALHATRNFAAMSDAALRAHAQALRVRDAAPAGDEHLIEVFATAREGASRLLLMRPFDVQMAAGVALARRAARPAGHRRGQDARRGAPGDPARAHGPRRARLHRQRLSRRARRRLDGAALSRLRPRLPRRSPRAVAPAARRRRLPRRHHLRHRARGGLRLSARPRRARRRSTSSIAAITSRSSTRPTAS